MDAERFTTVLEHGRREAILAAFAHAVVDDGYAAVTMGEVARRADLDVGEVCAFYADRAALAAGLLQRNARIARARIEGARRQTAGIEPWQDRMRELLRQYLEAMATDGTFMRQAVLEQNALDDVDPAVKVGIRDAYVALILDIGAEIAEASGGEPLDEARAVFVSVGMNELVARGVYRGVDPRQAMLDIIEPTIDVLARLMGVAVAPASKPSSADPADA